MLDSNILLAAIASRAYVFADQLSCGVSDNRKVSMSEYRYLGKSNHKVIPSCIVLKIRSHYPKSGEVYLGFKEY